MKWLPKWNRLIVKLDNVKEETPGGLVIPDSVQNLAKYNAIVGKVYSIGEGCWKDFGDGSPWAKVGQEVLFAKNAGWMLEEDDGDYRIMNDEDVIGVKEDG